MYKKWYNTILSSMRLDKYLKVSRIKRRPVAKEHPKIRANQSQWSINKVQRIWESEWSVKFVLEISIDS